MYTSDYWSLILYIFNISIKCYLELYGISKKAVELSL
jgi:hypothetical protein